MSKGAFSVTHSLNQAKHSPMGGGYDLLQCKIAIANTALALAMRYPQLPFAPNLKSASLC